LQKAGPLVCDVRFIITEMRRKGPVFRPGDGEPRREAAHPFPFFKRAKEWISSSFAHTQLNRVQVPLRRTAGKNTTVFFGSCAMQCMSCCELCSLMGMKLNGHCPGMPWRRCNSVEALGFSRREASRIILYHARAFSRVPCCKVGHMSYSIVLQLLYADQLLCMQIFLMNRSDLVISSPKPNV
jgi:hypothetical protein